MIMKNNGRKQQQRLMAEINITPFTDVVLVLLIIFMVATPFIFQASMKIQPPKAARADASVEKIGIAVNAQGEIFMGDEQVDLQTLHERLLTEASTRPDAAVVINGDREVKYERVIRVLDTVVRAGFRNTALGVELDKSLEKEDAGAP